MSSHDLPVRPHLDHLKNEAKALHKAFHTGEATARQRVRDAIGEKPALRLTDAQRVVAREYGFPSWARLRARVQAARGRDDVTDDASRLAFAVLRFAEGAAHLSRGYQPPDMPRLGEDVYVFAPSSRRVPSEEVSGFLAGLASPAILFPTTTRGVVAIQLLSELTGDRATSARAEFENQSGNLEDMVRQLALTPNSRVLLEFGDETHVVSLAAVRAWSERFAVHVGWSVGPLEDDARASARLNLYRSDGANSRL
jgi:hypothetical protein